MASLLDGMFMPDEQVEHRKVYSNFYEYAITDRRLLCLVPESGGLRVYSIAWDKITCVQRTVSGHDQRSKYVEVRGSNFECKMETGLRETVDEFYHLVLAKIF